MCNSSEIIKEVCNAIISCGFKRSDSYKYDNDDINSFLLNKDGKYIFDRPLMFLNESVKENGASINYLLKKCY